jgi:hypothetical protein
LEGFESAVLSVLPEMLSLSVLPLAVFEDIADFVSEEEGPVEPSLSLLLAQAEVPQIDIPDDVADAFIDWRVIAGVIDDLCNISVAPLATTFTRKHESAVDEEESHPEEEPPYELPVLEFDDIANHCDVSHLLRQRQQPVAS